MIRNTKLVLFLRVYGSACSSSKWVVGNRNEIDRNDFRLVDSKKFLDRIGNVSLDSTILNFQLKATNMFEYSQRVKTDRYIQRYIPGGHAFGSVDMETDIPVLTQRKYLSKTVVFNP